MEFPFGQRGFGPTTERIPTRKLSAEDLEKGAIDIFHTAPKDTSEVEPTILVAPGWGEGHTTLSKLANATAAAGRGIYTFNHRRHSDAKADPEMYKSTTLESVFDTTLIDNDQAPLTIVAHSEGAISAVRMAARMADSDKSADINALMLVAPAGITETTTPQRLLRRATSELVGNKTDANVIRALGFQSLIPTVRYTLPHIRLGLNELKAIACTDIRDDILKVVQAGIPVGILGCQRDKIFPINEMRSNCQALPVTYEEIDATHINFIAIEQVQQRVFRLVRYLEDRRNHNLIDKFGVVS